MAQFKTFCADHEILGANMLDIAGAINGEDFLPIYDKYGLAEVERNAWYPMSTLLNVLSEMAQAEDSMLNLVSVGMKAVEVIDFPPELTQMPFDQVMQFADMLYRFNHRGSDVGEIKVCQISENHFVQTVRVPLPDDLWYGVIYAFVRRFKPAGIAFSVYYDPDAPRHDHGGESTIYHIELHGPKC